MIFHSIPRWKASAGGLLPALAVSCALHVLLLWPDALPRSNHREGLSLTATLRAAQVAERPVATAPVDALAEARTSARTGTRSAQEQIVATRTDPQPELKAFPPAAEIVGVPTQATLPVGSGDGQQNRNMSALDGAPASPDAEGIRAYRIGLAREARAHRHYPQLARERGWTGTAEVRVDVSREGLPRQVLLARSSGHDILDREAVSMMSRAATAAELPESLRGRAFAVRLPVVFDIPEAQ